jgi:hypothetical protein
MMYDDAISCGFFLVLDKRFLLWRLWENRQNVIAEFFFSPYEWREKDFCMPA